MNLKFPEFFAPRNQSQSKFLALVFFASATPFLIVSAAQGQNTEEILRAVAQSEAKAQFSATQIVQQGNTREVATLFRSGAKRRLEWSAPAVKLGDILIDDGQTVTLYHRADRSAVQTRSFRRAFGIAAGNWKVIASKSQDGRPVRVLSRDDKRTITVDAKTNVILRTESAGSVTILQNLKFGSISDAKFQFVKPDGVTITRINGRLVNDLNVARRLTTWVQTPGQLPTGYIFESAVAGKNEIWLRYSNGQKRFSIFQQKTDDAGEITPQRVDGGWFWRKNGVRFLVTGAPDDAVSALAKSN